MNRVHINLFFFLSLIAIALMTFFVASAQAGPAATTTTSGDLFSGTFEGHLIGDRGSRAPLTLELDQDGRVITGDITLGRGLLIDGGNCGEVSVPATSQSASGTTTSRSPRHLDATSAFKVQGISVSIDLDADLSRDGEALTAVGNIDLPWLCGRDPVISGELNRVD